VRTIDVAVTEALRALAADYATGVDRRDAALVRSCFTEDADLIIRARDGVRPRPEHRIHGRDAIGGIAETIARYPRTFHLLGQARYAVDDVVASGELCCEAHHHTVGAGGAVTDRVLYIRYEDAYRRDADGDWLIAERIVGTEWSVDLELGVLGDRASEEGS
jgi:ketosteroid isomerase-like protein